MKRYITTVIFVFVLVITITNLYDFYTIDQNLISAKQNLSHKPLLQLSFPEFIPDNRDFLVKVNLNTENLDSRTLHVEWKSNKFNIKSDSFIGLFLMGTDNSKHFSSIKGISTKSETQETITIPEEAGVYQARFIMDSNLLSIAASQPIYLNFKEAKVSVSQSKILNKILVSWEFDKSNLNFLKTNDDQVYTLCLNLVGEYTTCVWSTDISNNPQGNIEVDFPEFSGFFVFRIVKNEFSIEYNQNYKTLCVSKIFKISETDYKLTSTNSTVIGSQIRLNWEIKAKKDLDWIGLFRLSDTNAFLRSSQPLISVEVDNINGNFSGLLPPNSETGPFVFVYFSNYRAVAISDMIFANQPVVSCPLIKNEAKTKIKHLFIICTENHSFENYFGNYCKAQTNTDPQCNIGRECCEKTPEIVQNSSPILLNDAENMAWDPNHNMDCELCQINNGNMDKFVSGCFCSSSRNFAVSDEQTVSVLWNLAANGALADHYFQPSAGATSQNDMYFARASFVFKDNSKNALGTSGGACDYFDQVMNKFTLYYDPSITSILDQCGITLRTYAQNFDFGLKNFTQSKCYPNGFDPTDIPFIYYAGVTNNPNYIVDYDARFFKDLEEKSLPEIVFIKPLGIRTAHPGLSLISAEQKFIKDTVDVITKSSYYNDSLIIWVPDESGGYYDHMKTPKTSDIDNIPYGARVPFITFGKFSKKNYISHVEMEHSSIVKFIEWNWLNGETGQLNTRDKDVNNILDMLELD